MIEVEIASTSTRDGKNVNMGPDERPTNRSPEDIAQHGTAAQQPVVNNTKEDSSTFHYGCFLEPTSNRYHQSITSNITIPFSGEFSPVERPFVLSECIQKKRKGYLGIHYQGCTIVLQEATKDIVVHGAGPQLIFGRFHSSSTEDMAHIIQFERQGLEPSWQQGLIHMDYESSLYDGVVVEKFIMGRQVVVCIFIQQTNNIAEFWFTEDVF